MGYYSAAQEQQLLGVILKRAKCAAFIAAGYVIMVATLASIISNPSLLFAVELVLAGGAARIAYGFYAEMKCGLTCTRPPWVSPN